ncbi:MAG: leucyl aminopeptidase [Desulfobacteraceae bacterium]|nr:leucyl aminopeptidase [Desulfobacteraceae bacterium]
METTRVTTTDKPVDSFETDLLVYLATRIKDRAPRCDKAVMAQVKKAFDLGDFKGKKGEQLFYYPQVPAKEKQSSARRILVLGLGEIAPQEDGAMVCDTLREAGGHLAAACKKIRAKEMIICLPSLDTQGPEQVAQSLVEGVLLGDYRFTKYKETTKKKTDYEGIAAIKLACKTSVKLVRKGMIRGKVCARAVCAARDMAHEPGNGWTSADFAGFAKTLANTHGLDYRCIEKKEMEKMGMGGILAVNQGSAIPPRMIILEYQPAKKSETLLLVGKGVTFDSGGISLKPGAGMEEMKYDMCGGAAVLAAMQAVGEEKPDLGVVAIIPATDNMPGGSAVRPGDIIQHFNQVTAEIVNTDAEGRMILGDALAYGIKTFKPDCVVDVATLTGAVVIGLGHHYTGLISNNDTLAKSLEAAGKQAGEPLWRLPLNKHYKKQIESKVADIKNIGGKAGGTITAAAYLSHFVGKTPWAHLDIAGTAWDFTKKTYIPKGPSGICVRTFLNLIKNWKTGKLK